jgi:hypothetical protein
LSWPNEPEQCTSPIKLPSHCEQVAIPVQGWLAQELSDHPRAQTIYTFPTDRPPGLATDFYFADSPSTAQDIYGLLNSRRFTTSVEYSVSP